MKQVFIFYVFISVITIMMHSCINKDAEFIRSYELSLESKNDVSEQELINLFEEKFIKEHKSDTRSHSYDPVDCDIELIGYKTISYHGDDSTFVNKLWGKYYQEIEQCGFALPLKGKIRVYFRMKNAIVSVDKKIYKADTTGIMHGVDLSLDSKIRLIGSEKSAHSTRTLLTKRYSPESVRIEDKVVIFNLGERITCCSKNIKFRSEIILSEGEPGVCNVPCVNNHPGFPNCSKAFNITTERCPFKSDRCMDYNGWGTDCSGSHLYFAGSDCFYAMGKGHCWNELM